jgi:DNA-damage-inducible protein J
MEKTQVIHARVTPTLKQASEEVFETLGLTMADAIRLFLKQVELHDGLPFDVKIPNAASRKAIKEARNKKSSQHYSDFLALRKKLKV